MANELFEALAIAAVVGEVAALVFALAYGNLLGVAVINIACSLAIFIVNAPTIGYAIESQDVAFLLLLAFALTAVVTNLLWLRYPQQLRWFVWTEFSIFALLSLAVLVFVFTFKITRLF
ncbi:MAG: hypothetical protein M3O03_09120 [Pseudomonadota bacterium]|nr:hypothetical protein [Pseudomonadota bacterium]